MFVIVAISIAILITAGIVLMAWGIVTQEKYSGLAASVGTVLVIIGILVLVHFKAKENPEPTAIDVYRGKTTLQITYLDSIPMDTVVVWKEEE